MDPVTLIVAAVAAGAARAAKDTATQAVRDAYTGLKRLLDRHDIDVAALERRPDSDVQKAAIGETLVDALSAADVDDQQELLNAAQALIKELRQAHGASATEVLGVDLAQVEAEFIRVQQIRSSGTAFRGRGLTTTGGIEIGVVEAGIDKPAGP